MIDTDGIHRAVLNIVTNAIDACEGSEHAQVSIKTRMGCGDSARAHQHQRQRGWNRRGRDPVDLSVIRFDQGLAGDGAGPAGLTENHPRARRQDLGHFAARARLDVRDRDCPRASAVTPKGTSEGPTLVE